MYKLQNVYTVFVYSLFIKIFIFQRTCNFKKSTLLFNFFIFFTLANTALKVNVFML